MAPQREPIEWDFRPISKMDFSDIMEEYIRLAPFMRMTTEEFQRSSKLIALGLVYAELRDRVAELRAAIERWVPRPEGGHKH